MSNRLTVLLTTIIIALSIVIPMAIPGSTPMFTALTILAVSYFGLRGLADMEFEGERKLTDNLVKTR